MNDLIIRGVLIVNKSGSELATGNIGIREGVIGAIYERGLIDTQEDELRYCRHSSTTMIS